MSAADITGRLARYMVEARERSLALDVAREARHRILDTLAAMVSGAHLKPGEMAIRYARAQGGVEEATVLTTDITTSAINAALVNAMFGHADETDDFHPATKAHPGCAVVPAALAMAEREGRSGTELLRAVTLGYDLCCRFLLALGADLVRRTHRSAEGTSSTMGSVGAAAALARLDEKAMRHALSYAAQQVSGIWSWVRDAEHVEKAFDFSGMGEHRVGERGVDRGGADIGGDDACFGNAALRAGELDRHLTGFEMRARHHRGERIQDAMPGFARHFRWQGSLSCLHHISGEAPGDIS